MGPPGLDARTEAAGTDSATPPDGLDAVVFASPGRTLWGSGLALRIDLPAPWPDHVGIVSDALNAIRTFGADGEVVAGGLGVPAGSGPVAFGALPFDRVASRPPGRSGQAARSNR